MTVIGNSNMPDREPGCNDIQILSPEIVGAGGCVMMLAGAALAAVEGERLSVPTTAA